MVGCLGPCFQIICLVIKDLGPTDHHVQVQAHSCGVASLASTCALHITTCGKHALSTARSGGIVSGAHKCSAHLHICCCCGDCVLFVCRYKVDPELVQRALSRVCLPDIVEAEGPGSVKAFAEWPVWFQRRS